MSSQHYWARDGGLINNGKAYSLLELKQGIYQLIKTPTFSNFSCLNGKICSLSRYPISINLHEDVTIECGKLSNIEC